MQMHAEHYDPDLHLAIVRLLCTELQAGHSALVNNRIDDLRHHIERQESLCTQLTDTLQRAAVIQQDEQRGSSAIPNEICAAHSHLAHLSRRTAIFLRHCRRTVEVLRAHYGQAFDGSGAGVSPASANRDWSCEA